MEHSYEDQMVNVPEGTSKSYFAPIVIQAFPDTNARVAHAGGVGQYLGSGMYCIPAKSKNIEKVVKMIDYFETDAYPVLGEWGIEGYTFTVGADGLRTRLEPNARNIGVDMNVTYIATPTPFAGWQTIFPRYMKGDEKEKLPNVIEVGKSMGYPEGYTLKASMMQQFFETKWPTVIGNLDSVMAFPSATENDRVNQLLPDLNTYSSELLTALIIGEKSLNNWNAYMADLKRLGLDEIITIYQARADRIGK
jgi:hypothetical protein